MLAPTGGLSAAAQVAHAGPTTALRPEGPCSATLRRCPVCPTPAARRSASWLLLRCLQASGIWQAPAAGIRPESLSSRRSRYPRIARLTAPAPRCLCQYGCRTNRSMACCCSRPGAAAALPWPLCSATGSEPCPQGQGRRLQPRVLPHCEDPRVRAGAPPGIHCGHQSPRSAGC